MMMQSATRSPLKKCTPGLGHASNQTELELPCLEQQRRTRGALVLPSAVQHSVIETY